jgi:hypothetical protein
MTLLFHPGTVALLTLSCGIVLFAHTARSKGASTALVASGTSAFVTGSVCTLLMLGHLAAVTLLRSSSGGSVATSGHCVRIGDFVYDFRFYSLILLGVLILLPGLYCFWSAAAATRGEYRAQQRILYASIVILATTLPLTPIQPYAAVLAALAGLNLLTLSLSRTCFIEDTFASGEDWARS